MTRLARALMVCAAAAGSLHAASSPPASSDPLALLTTLGVVDAAGRTRVDTGAAVVTVLPSDGRDLAVFGVTRVSAPGGRLAEWTREIELLYKSRYMPIVRRFSNPPVIEDLAGLTLDEDDLADLRRCKPGDCGVKLNTSEIDQVRAAATAAGAQWKDAVQIAFRRIMLARAEHYLARGFAAMPPYHDHRQAMSPQGEFDEIATRFGYGALYDARVLPFLHAYPGGEPQGIESFLYWAKETLGKGKPIVSINHVSIFRSPDLDAPRTVVTARQVFATHYLAGSLSVTTLTGGTGGAPGYLLYLRRSRTDAFDGTFGKVIRGIVERRVRAEGPTVLDALRRKLEGGDPRGAESSQRSAQPLLRPVG